jgi:hypothetical protein
MSGADLAVVTALRTLCPEPLLVAKGCACPKAHNSAGQDVRAAWEQARLLSLGLAVSRAALAGHYRHMTGIAGQTAWTWAQTAVVVAALIAIAGGVVIAALTYGLNQRVARRERQAKAFADALTAIEDYAEMPYRIHRRRATREARHDLTEQISQIQSRIAFHQAWLQIEAPGVAQSYEELVRAAKGQAGSQMREAWELPAATTDAHMSLGTAYPRGEINVARDRCVTAMRHDLGRAATGARDRPPEKATSIMPRSVDSSERR